MRQFSIFFLAAAFCTLATTQNAPSASSQGTHQQPTFTDPLLRFGPDPSVEARDGFYYYMNTMGKNLTIWKTRDLTDLRHAERKIVWTPPPDGPYSSEIWAPELHFVNGKWYIYFAADNGHGDNHRNWVLENSSPDPLTGEWIMKGQLTDKRNQWAIDPSVFENKGQLYALWSGHDSDFAQCIYIALMKNAWTVDGTSHKISSPTYDWEKAGDPGDDRYPYPGVNEGPEILKHGGKIFLIFSASGCWTDHYALGVLTAAADANLLKASSWKKRPMPAFSSSPSARAFGPGHNTFFKSPDGTQDWILYHANPQPHKGCDNFRSPRAQPFTWTPDGTPDFGTPVPLQTPLPKPSGTPEQ